MGVAAGRIPVDAATRRKAVVAPSIGNFVEWYDFIIYGHFANVIAAQFSPPKLLAGILATFAVFGVSFSWFGLREPSWWAATATGSGGGGPSRSSSC